MPITEQLIELNDDNLFAEFLRSKQELRVLDLLESGEATLEQDEHGQLVARRKTAHMHRQLWVVFLAAKGMRVKDIANATGYSIANVSNILKASWARKLTFQLQERIADKSIEEASAVKALVAREFRTTVEKLIEIRDTGDAKESLQAIKELNRLLGMTEDEKKSTNENPTAAIINNIIVACQQKIG